MSKSSTSAQNNEISHDASHGANTNKPSAPDTAANKSTANPADNEETQDDPDQPEAKNIPPPPSRKELLASAAQSFGNDLEFIDLTDHRVPQIFRKDFHYSAIENPGEFVAVDCNHVSNLAAIVFRYNLEFINQFLDSNPTLWKSLETMWGNLFFIWIRVKGWRPANRALPGMLWISQGMLPTIIERVERSEKGIFKKANDSIVPINFDDIVWPQSSHEDFLLEKIESRHGSIIKLGGPGDITINYNTAALLLSQVLKLTFDGGTDRFRYHPPGSKTVEALPKIQLHLAISSFLNKKVAGIFGALPAGDHVKIIDRKLKELCAVHRLDEPDGLNFYFDQCVEQRAGSNVTVKELFNSYAVFCKTAIVAIYPQCEFFNVLTGFIREKYGLTKVHNIMRLHEITGKPTARYGFKGLGFKQAPKPVPEVKEQKEAKDGEEAREQPEGAH